MRADLGASYAELGLVVASLPAGGMLGGFFAVAADYVDRRWLAAGGALGYAACLLVFATATWWQVLVIAGLVWGAAGDALVQGCEVALVDLYRDDLAPAIGRVNALAALGDLASPLTIAAVAACGFGWRAVFGLGAAAMLLYAAWLASQTFPPPAARTAQASVRRALLDVVRDRRVLLLGAVSGLFGLLDEPFLGFAAAFLERAGGAPPALATVAVSASLAAGIAGFLLVPWFTARWRAVALMTALGVSMAAEVGALVGAPPSFYPLQAAALAAFGFTGAVFYAVLKGRLLALRPGQAGTTKAVVSTIGHAGVLFPAAVGAVADAAGLRAGLALYAAVPVLIVVLILLAPDDGG